MTEQVFTSEQTENLDIPEEAAKAVADAEFFPDLAEAFRLQGKTEEAIKICRLGLEKNPHKLKGHLVLGRCYLEKGLWSLAKEELEKVQKEMEACFLVYRLLSQVYLQEKDVERALETLRNALFFSATEKKEEKGLPPLEINIWQKKLEPFFFPAQAEKKEEKTFQTETLAQIYLKQGRKEKALEIYRELLAREPENNYLQEKYATLAKDLAAEKKLVQRQKVIDQLEKWLAVVSLREKQFLGEGS